MLSRLQTLQRLVDDHERLLTAQQEADKRQRLARWAEAMQEPRRAHLWVRGALPPAPAVQAATGRISRSTGEALDMLRERWRGVWDRDCPAPGVWKAYLEANLPRLEEGRWPDLDETDLKYTLRQLRGSSAGPDGWTGDELEAAEFILGAVSQLFCIFEDLEELQAGTRPQDGC